MSRGDVNVSCGDYDPRGLSFTGHCERIIYVELMERRWNEERTNYKKTQLKSLRGEIERKDGDAVQALSNLFG